MYKNIKEELKAVKQNGDSLYYIKNPSLEVQFEAVKQNSNSIKFIKSPEALLKKYPALCI